MPKGTMPKGTASEPADAPAREPKDVVAVRGVSEDGESYHVIRMRERRIEGGVVKPLKEGQPIDGEVVKLTPRPESPVLFDVDVQFERQRSESAARPGPAQVATGSYRTGWETIWGKPARKRRDDLN